MIVRIFPTKDTSITDMQRDGIPQTGSNVGASEILQLFTLSSASMSPSGSVSHVLSQFDVSSFPTLGVPTTGVRYHLVMRDAQHAESLPSSYDVEISPVSGSWDEGDGIDVDTFYDQGYANWCSASLSRPWTSVGGDRLDSPTASFHFDTGHEDLNVDVTSIVSAWLTGTFENNGFFINITSSLERNDDLFVKMFHARNTHFLSRRPYVEAAWDDSISDDRSRFFFDVTGSLCMYNAVDDQFVDVGSGTAIVSISDASGTIATATGSKVAQGIYSASLCIPYGSYSGSVFYDAWSVGGVASLTSSFRISRRTPTSTMPSAGPYFVNVVDLKDEYRSDDLTRMRLFVRDKGYSPAVVHTASSDSYGTVIKRAFYSITDDRTGFVVVPFDTGSTKTSYDRDGNYFDFRMSSLPPDNVYRIKFAFDVAGNRTIIDDGFKFKVR